MLGESKINDRKLLWVHKDADDLFFLLFFRQKKKKIKVKELKMAILISAVVFAWSYRFPE